MSLRDDLIPCVDAARGLADELGVRVRPVAVVRRSWDGGKPGLGVRTEEPLTLTPTPRVRPATRETFGPGGSFEAGDLVITRISASYAEATLRGAPVGEAEEVVWEVDGEAHRLVSLERRPFEWRAQLRRLRR